MKNFSLENTHGSIAAYEQGAHLSSWHCRGTEQLFMSKQALFEPGAAIRGGVPICFPQFAGFGSGQKHGFARNVPWQRDTHANESLRFTLCSNETTKALWPHDFKLVFEATINEDTLNIGLEVKNTGANAFDFRAALHTYFRVSDVRNIQITNLRGHSYWDNGTPFDVRNTDAQESIAINGPIDRVYFGVDKPVSLKENDSVKRIEKTGFPDIVVWNPWKEGASGIEDMADDEYFNMMCVEAAIVENPETLASGESWVGEQLIRLL